jgi:alpha-tubulin suppressor-like RCC1 family protein
MVIAAVVALIPLAVVIGYEADAAVATDWQSAVAGNGVTCAVRVGGTLWCWGYNVEGQVGDGTTTNRSMPVRVGSATNWDSVSTGGSSECALRADDTLWCWGHNGQGQLGNGTTTNRSSPTQVGTATDWQAIVAGDDSHNCGIRGGGSLWCWGSNEFGKLGDGTTTNRSSPAQVGADTDWQVVEVGYSHTCGIRAGGTLWCWGYNLHGQLGNGTSANTPNPSPVQVGSDTDWAAIEVGWGHTCGLRAGGTLWCWGYNLYGQLGNGTSTGIFTPNPSPIQVGTDTDWQSVETGGDYTCGIRAGGTLWCWGTNEYGQLGNGTSSGSTPNPSPIQVGTDTDWQGVEGGNRHTCGVRTDATAWCWGSNQYGALGDGTNTDRDTPTEVQLPDDNTAPTITSASPTDGATYGIGQVVNASFSCADNAGGSGVASCVGTVSSGSPLDTAAPGGTRVFEVTAVDNAGNVTRLVRRYHVGAPGPVVAVASPPNHANYPTGQPVTASFDCGPTAVTCVGTVPSGSAIDTTLGLHVFSVTGTDASGRTTTEEVSYAATALDSASSTVGSGGGTVTTGSSPTPSDPFQTAVSSPNGGLVEIAEQVNSLASTGYTALGAQVSITAPPASASNPLVLTFYGDGSALPPGTNHTNLALFRNGTLLTDCLGATTVPGGQVACISGRDLAPSGGGDIRITVIATDASDWSLAAKLPAISPYIGVVAEGNSGTRTVNVPVLLPAAADRAISVQWATQNSTATAPSDYTTASGTLTFLPGQSTRTVSITIKGDTTEEQDEIVLVAFSNPTNATIGGFFGLGFGVVQDDDRPALAVNNVSVVEGNTGTKNMKFTVTLDRVLTSTVTVTYATANGTASSPGDYQARTGTVTFNPGKISRPVKVPIVGDTVAEPNETLQLRLSAPSTNARLADSLGIGTVTNND